MKTFLIIIFFILFIWFVIYLTASMMKQSAKDWATLKDLEERADKVSSKKEIEEFHKEFLEKAKKINNNLIGPRLAKIDGYLRGLYKQYEE